MTDSETIDKAKALFTGATQGDLLAREVIAIAEQREQTVASEVEHSRRLEDKLKNMHGLLEPLRDAVLYARAQRRSMRIGQDSTRAPASVRLELGTEYGLEREAIGFWVGSDETGPNDTKDPDPVKGIALALLRLSYEIAEKAKPRP